MTIPTATLHPQAPPQSFLQQPLADSSGTAFTAITGATGMVVRLWRYVCTVSAGGNFGLKSSGGQVLLPKGGGVTGATQYIFQDFPPDRCFVPWVQSLVGEGLIVDYDAGSFNGNFLYTIEIPNP